MAVVALAACRTEPSAGGDGTETETTGSTTMAPTTVPPATDPSTTTTTTDGDTTSSPNWDIPPTPALDTPDSQAVDVPIETQLCWHLVEDPDGDEVRYRVFVDNIELTQGKLGEEEGYAGPCTPPLNLNHEQTYSWEVLAFEAENPDRASDPSDSRVFTTVSDGLTSTVFEDDFDDDLGWEVSGDATSGAWVRGDPAVAMHMSERSQSSVCGWGTSCYFTGQNKGGVADDEDVSGGSTILTSPEFDLSDAAAGTVQLTRWVFNSEGGAGPEYRVELLIPDGDEPDGYAVHELEAIDTTANLWTPVEYALCGLPMGPGNRLRITATDEGSGIFEGGLDRVSVHAHLVGDVCGTGENGICDPVAKNGGCPEDLLCCSQGTINEGVFRCSPPAAGLDFESPPGSPDDPGNGTVGCDAPDLTIDPSRIDPSVDEIDVTPTSCTLFEGCVDAQGARSVMRFALFTPNIGSRDLTLGIAANNPAIYHYSDCHEHYHFDEYARYELQEAGGGDSMATGHKQAFCLLDSTGWAWDEEVETYDCANQGISRGWGDIYSDFLPCQWIDITGVPPGDYVIYATINQPRLDSAYPTLNEMDYTNNTVTVPVTIE